MDALAEVLHILEMLHPKSVEDAEINFALDFAHEFGAEFGFFLGVFGADGGKGGAFAILLFAHVADALDEIGVKRKDGGEFLGEVRVDAGAVFDEVGDASVDETVDFVLDVGAVEDFAAHAIDDLAVAVDDVIVLDDVLAGVEVEAFDALLSGLEGFGDGAVLDGGVFVDAEAGHE